MGLFGNIIGQIIGIVAVLVGLSIMMNIDQKKLGAKQTNEIEQPDASWNCPKCESTNPNTTYTCTNCGRNLI